jgi:hypothetical protein
VTYIDWMEGGYESSLSRSSGEWELSERDEWYV